MLDRHPSALPRYRVSRKRDPLGRFYSKVRSFGEGCWLWCGTMSETGYGMFKLDGHSMHASRAAYILTYGPVAKGALVCHRCDTPRCVRPDHLFLGTHADNMADAVAKGRIPLSRLGKLSPQARVEIKARRLAGESLTALATAYGVTRAAIVKTARR